MVESEEVARDIREIKWHQAAIDNSLELLIKANRDNLLNEVINFFGQSKRRAEVYLAIDGERSVSNIAQLLNMKLPNVSIEISKLSSEALIEIKKIKKNESIYKKCRLDKIIGISTRLKKIFEI